VSVCLTANGFGIGEEGAFEKLSLELVQKLNRSDMNRKIQTGR